MTQRAVLCCAPGGDKAGLAIDEMRKSGLLEHGVSFLMPARDGTEKFFSSGASVVAVPGIGSMRATGPVLEAFTDGTCRGISDALATLGMAGTDAAFYEEKMRNGGILIAVQSNDPRVTDRALGIFEHAHFNDIVCINAEADEENLKTDSF